MLDKPSESKKVTKEANVTETSAKKSDQKPTADRKYSLGSAQVLLAVVLITLLAGTIGYGMSRGYDYHQGMDRFHDRMMSDNYDTGTGYDRYRSYPGGMGMYDTGKRLHGMTGEIDQVSDSQISIKPLQGGITTFKLDANTKVYEGADTKKVSDLKSGQTVQIVPDQSDPTLAYKIESK